MTGGAPPLVARSNTRTRSPLRKRAASDSARLLAGSLAAPAADATDDAAAAAVEADAAAVRARAGPRARSVAAPGSSSAWQAIGGVVTAAHRRRGHPS